MIFKGSLLEFLHLWWLCQTYKPSFRQNATKRLVTRAVKSTTASLIPFTTQHERPVSAEGQEDQEVIQDGG